MDSTATATFEQLTREQRIQVISANMMMMGVPCVFCGRRATKATGNRRWTGLERNGEIQPAHVACVKKWAGIAAALIAGLEANSEVQP
jgi:hypothetical protein